MVAKTFSRILMVVFLLVSGSFTLTGVAVAQSHGPSPDNSNFNVNAPSDAGVLDFGPMGGTVNALVMDPKTPTTLYAATDYGVYKTTNNGDNWFLSGLISTQVYALAVDPVNPNNIYAGTRDVGFYMSKDGGITWTESSSLIMMDKIIYTVVVDPVNPRNIYAGGREANVDGLVSNWWGGGVFKSTDDGVTWQAVNNGLPEGWVYSIAINPQNPLIVYAGTHSMGVYKSFDGGATWAARTGGMANYPPAAPKADNLKIRSLAIDPQNPDILLVGVWGGNSLFITTNGGENGWANITKGIYASQIRTVAIDPINPYIFYAGLFTGGLYHNGNSGSGNWTVLPGQWGFFKEFNAIDINPTNDGIIFVAVDGAGVFRSMDGGATWVAINHGLTGTNVSKVIIDPKNSSHMYAATYGTGVFESSDMGLTWNYKVWAFQWDWVKDMAIDPITPGTLYIATDNYGIGISQDGGLTWDNINHNLPTGSPQPIQALSLANPDQVVSPAAPDVFPVVYAVAAAPTTPTVTLYAGTWGHGTWGSKDGGISWYLVDAGTAQVTSIQVYPNDPNWILITTADQGLIRAHNLGTGIGWQYSNINQGLGSLNVLSAVVDSSTNPATLYAGTATGLFKSVDNGATWKLYGLAQFQIDGITIDPTNKNIVYAATQQDGVYKTIYGGTFWFRLGLPTTPVNTLNLDPASKDVLFASTTGGGIIRFTQSQMIPVTFITNLFIKIIPAAGK